MSIKKQEDPRAIRSKKEFKKAALSLLIEEPSAPLTVQKIADRAELNRATFYLHFEDINDLLKQITNEIFDELSMKLDPLVQSEITDNREHLTIFLDYIYENRKFFSLSIEHKDFEIRLFGLVKNLIEIRRTKRGIEEQERYVLVDILASSIMGIIMWWIKEGIHYSSEYMAKQITLLYRRLPIA